MSAERPRLPRRLALLVVRYLGALLGGLLLYSAVTGHASDPLQAAGWGLAIMLVARGLHADVSWLAQRPAPLGGAR